MSHPESSRSAEVHALEILEFPRVLERIAGLAVSEPGRRAVRELRPWRELDTVHEALATTDEMVGMLLRYEDWAPPPIPDAGRILRRLAPEGSILDVDQLPDILGLLRASRLVRGDLRRLPDDLPRLAALGDRMVRLEKLEARLDRSLKPAGGLADAASPELARTRRSLREARSSIVRRLEQFIRRLPERLRVLDASVTIRAGRYCVPVRREAMSQVGGIVHDESATHRTLFVEPPEAIEPMNRIAELEREEHRETLKVLRDLTDLLRPHGEAVTRSAAALAEADSLYARARYALRHGGAPPEVRAMEAGGEWPGYRAVQAQHPLLEVTGEPVVPFDLDVGPEERVLLISGPNAGGKTVLLKAVGLLSAMAQAGIVPPIGRGSRFPLFRSFFALIGDEQSIQASLSTFSAQVEGLRVILAEAEATSLVLIDEVGGSTDPAEGAALAAAVLLRLAGQAGLSVATTHLGELKDLAAHESAVVNASLQFDTRALRPTFRLVRDRPGRSYALEIAHRLGLPEDVLRVARSRLSDAILRVDGLLQELEEREVEMDRLTTEARVSARRSRRHEELLAESTNRLARREEEIEREARARVERYLLEARRDVETEVERLRSEVARAVQAGEADPGAFDDAVRQARSAVEERLREARKRPHAPEGLAEPVRLDLSPGLRVRSRSLGVEGEVLEVREGEAVIEAGGLRFNLDPADLQAGGAPSGNRLSDGVPAAPFPELAPATEVNLRGLRVDEVEATLGPALDAAFVHDLPSLRVIHGKGTGALREEVSRILGADRRVRAFRPGGFHEGGSGVTVVEFEG